VHLHGVIGDLNVPVEVADSIPAAVDGAELVAIPVPGSVQERYVRMVFPHLAAGQAVWLCQGGGASLLPEARARSKDLLLIESMYIPYSSRRTGPTEVVVRSRLRVPFAAFPARRTDEAARILGRLFDLPRARDVLEVALQNVNAIIHPLPCVLNWGQIEDRESEFILTRDGMTPKVVRAMEAYDAERVAVCRAAGLSTRNVDELYELFGMVAAPYRRRGTAAAEAYEDRYIVEDVPIGAVTFASAGRQLGVQTPLIDSTIRVCDTIYAMDSWTDGRTLERLGLGGLDARALASALMNG
jgi:opine dehydrogenase